MALRQAVSVLAAWNTRLLTQASTTASAAVGLQGQLSDARDEQHAVSSTQVASFASSAQGQALLAQQRMDAAAPQASTSLPVRFLSSALLRSHRPSMLLQRRPQLPGMQLQQQEPQQQALGAPTRAYNAWSPAQRYFVEGDHVIQAEANRTIQFTGLDAGSFQPFVVYTIFAAAVSCVFVVLPFLVAPSRVDLDKSSAYECGFDAFGEARQTFSVSFYLVSIMYLLFDIEIAYLFPYVMTHANAPMFWTMNLFLGILVAGFVYEWGVGALEWRDSETS